MRIPWRKHQKPVQKDETRLTTNRDGVIISVARKDYRPFYDTTWSVDIIVDGANTKRHIFDVVRHDDETATKLEKEIRSLDLDKLNRSQIFCNLDCKNNIYYD